MFWHPSWFAIWLTEGSVDQWFGAVGSIAAVVVALHLAGEARREAERTRLEQDEKQNRLATVALLHAYTRLEALDAMTVRAAGHTTPKANIAQMLGAAEAAYNHALSLNPSEQELLDGALNAAGTVALLRGAAAAVQGEDVPCATVAFMLSLNRPHRAAYRQSLLRRHGRPFGNDDGTIAEINKSYAAKT